MPRGGELQPQTAPGRSASLLRVGWSQAQTGRQPGKLVSRRRGEGAGLSLIRGGCVMVSWPPSNLGNYTLPT